MAGDEPSGGAERDADEESASGEPTGQGGEDGLEEGTGELEGEANRPPSDGSGPGADVHEAEELEDIPGVGATRAEALREAGLQTVADVAAASREELADVPGIGDVLAARIEADVGDAEETAERDDVDGGGADDLEGEEGLDEDGTDDAGEDDDSSEVDVEEAIPPAEGVESGDAEDEVGGFFGGGPGGPADDREMPLADHIREMMRRLGVVVAVAGLVSLLAFPFAEEVINFLWYSVLPGVESDIARPRLYGVLELLFTQLKVASLAGLIVALPVLVYETYAFMKPGLYPHERRYYLAAIPTSLVLALLGVSFAYFVVLPAIFVYFLYYSQDVATIGFALGRTFDLILLLMGYMAIVFQIPLFIMLAMMMGLVTREWLAGRRLIFWGAFLGISFLFSPDPTGMAPVLVAATMIVLFEGTLLLTKWTGRG